MRHELKGVHKVSVKLSGRARTTYYYAWRGGPRIKAEPNTPEFLEAFQQAHRDRKKPAAGTLFGLIAAYRASSDFTGLSTASQKNYSRYLRLIEDEFGTMPLAAVEDKEARGLFKEWRDGMASKPRAADYAWQTLVRVLSFGVDRGKLSVNVCSRGGRLYSSDRKESIWTEDHIARFIGAASRELSLALVLGLWTGQRQGDLIRLGWSAYQGGQIKVRQSKTGRRVVIPVKDTLRQILATAPKRALTILTNQDGDPWTGDGFRASWGKACAKAGIDDVTFHDIRGTAVTRLALSGCEITEIAAITGHSMKDVTDILDRFYLSRDVRLAEAAMIKLEAHHGT